MSFLKKKSKSKTSKGKKGGATPEEQRRKMEEMYAKSTPTAMTAATTATPVVVTPKDPSPSLPSTSSPEPGTTTHAKPTTTSVSASTSSTNERHRYTYSSYIAPKINKGKFITNRHLKATQKDETIQLASPSMVIKYASNASITDTINLEDAIPFYPWMQGLDDTIFRGAGEKAGLEVWQLFGMRPEPVMRHHYGTFNSGDCYIVLKTFDAQDEAERLRKVHMWMGKKANNIKRAICAYMTYELCNRLSQIGSATQYLQEEGMEEMEFMNSFPKVEYMDKSSSEETLQKIPPKESETTLIRIVEEGRLYAKRIPLRSLSDLESHGVYVLVTDHVIFVFSGSDSAEPTRIKGIDVATMIQHEEKKGKATIKHVMQDSATDEEFEMISYLAQVASSHVEPEDTNKDIARLHRIGVEDSEDGELRPKVTEVKDRPLSRDMLASLGTYILETRHELFIWYGYHTSMFERFYANKLVEKIVQDHPNLAVTKFFQEGETILFKERFTSGFYMVETPETYAQRQRFLSNVTRGAVTDEIPSHFDEYTDKKKQKKYIDNEDDGRGAVRMFRVIDSKTAVPVPTAELGQFYDGECYLILYEFNRGDVVHFMTDDEDDEEEDDEYDDDEEEEEQDYHASKYHGGNYSFDDDSMEAKLAMIRNNPAILQCETEDLTPSKTFEEQIRESEENRKREEEEQLKKLEQEMAEMDTRNKFPKKDKSAKRKKICYLTRRILYCWEGGQSNKKVNSRILKENFMGLATDPINPAKVVTHEEGKESEHFMQIFEHAMVVHTGNYEERSATDMRLYRIYCKTVIHSRAIEVPKTMSSLNSNDVFVLVGTDTAWVWCGMYASNTKKRIALKFGQVLCAGREVTAVEEGLVPEEFFEDLSEFEEDYVQIKLRYSQGIVYHCSVTSEKRYRILDIGEVGKNFLKEDLDSCQTTMIFDFGSALYVWYPRTPTEAEKSLALHAASAMIEDDEDDGDDGDGSSGPPKTPSIKILEIQRGKEPTAFRQGFPQWHEQMSFVDKFALRVDEQLKHRSDMVRRSLPFLQTMRDKYSYLLTNDEYVNVENMLYFIDAARKSNKNYHMLVATLEYTDNVEWEDVDSFAGDVLKFYISEFSTDDQRRDEAQRK